MKIDVFASGSTGNCYRISDGQTSLLLDAGIPFKKIQIGCGFQMSQISGCFVTHCHMDHAKAVEDLANHGVDVYMSKGTIDICDFGGRRIKVANPLEQIEVGTFKILPFDVEHDAPDPLGFLFTSTLTGEKLLYFTDTYYVRYKFYELTHIMGEANYSKIVLEKNVQESKLPVELAKRLFKSHMSIENFLELLKANDLSKVRQIYLLHLSDKNSDEENFKRQVQQLTGAEVYVC